MGVDTVFQEPSRLLEVINKLTGTAGADLRSPGGPSAAPPEALVREFEELLHDGQSVRQLVDAAEAAGRTGIRTDGAGQAETAGRPGDPGAVTAPDGTAGALPAPGETAAPDNGIRIRQTSGPESSRPVPAEDPATELSGILENIRAQGLTPSQLFRLQYLVTILGVQGQSGIKINEQTAQSFETVLKQQG